MTSGGSVPIGYCIQRTLGLNYLQRSMMKCEKLFKQNKSRNSTLLQSLPLKSRNLYLTLNDTALSKVFRVAANVHSAIDLLRKVNNHLSLSPSRLAKAKYLIISLHQQEFFTEDFFRLKAGQEVSRKSKLLNVCPFYDGDTGTIRVGGRLSQSSLESIKNFLISFTLILIWQY